LLYELLTGRPPFIGDSPVAVAYQHVREAPATPSAVAPDVPEVLDRITLKALAKDRTARYSSAAEFRADLENAVRGGAITAPALGVAAAAAGLGAGAAAADLQPTMVESATQVMAPAGAGAPNPWATSTAPAVPPGEEPPGEDEEEPKSRKGLMWALIAVGVLALAAIITMIVISNQGADEATTGTVPTLSAPITPEEAEKAITDAGFEYAEALDQESTQPEGTFTRTDPAGGTEADRGSTATAFFPAAPDPVVVHDAKGKTQDEPRQILEGQGLTVTSGGSEDSKDVPKDAVTRTDPAAGQSVAAGSTVTLYTSSGLVSLPDLVGGQRAAAERAITDLGLKPVVNEVESDEPEGQVVAQRPNAGSVPQGSEVTIDVAIPRS